MIKLSIGARIFIGFLIIVFFSMGSLLVSYKIMQKVEKSTEEIMPIVNSIENKDMSLSEGLSDLKAYYGKTQEILNDSGESLTIVLFGIICFSIIISLLLTHFIVFRLAELNEATKSIREGHYDIKLDIESGDEIGELGLNFQKMAQFLKETTVSKEFIVNVTNSINDALLVLSLSGKIKSINAAGLRILEYENEKDALDDDFYSVFMSNGQDVVKEMERLVEGGELINYETTMNTRGDNSLPVLISGSIMENVDKDDLRVILTIRDITNRKEMQLRLQDKNKELENALRISESLRDDVEEEKRKSERAFEEIDNTNKNLKKNEKALKNLIVDLEKTHNDLKDAQRNLVQSEKLASIGQLAAGIAHEINNPIGFISSNLSTLNKYLENISKLLRSYENLKGALDKNDMEKAKSLKAQIYELEQAMDLGFVLTDVDALMRESEEGLDRIKKIVSDLRTFSRRDESDRVDANMNEVLDGILNIVWNEIKYKAEVIKKYGNINLIKCNPQQIGQVFMNLLMNAAQSMDNKGEITIKTSEEKGSLRIDISDTGKGISEDNLSSIFDPFFTTKEVGVGTGLGLSISYDIIKQHGGDIEVDSKEGSGTTFSVILPVNV